MTKSLKVKIAVDLAMTLVLLVQMGYMLTGDLSHEITGTVMIALWIAHNLLNRKWYSSLMKGRYPLKRIINSVLNLLLLLAVAGQIVSAVIMSSYVFRFLGIQIGMGFARLVHMVCAYWLLVLSSLHLGLHWSRIIKILKTKTAYQPSLPGKILMNTLAVGVSCFGLYAFIKNQIPIYMFMRTQFVFFDFSQSAVLFFLEYISILVLFASLSYYGSAVLAGKQLSRRSSCSVSEES